MTRPVAGLDGCPDGWIVVVEAADGALSAWIARHFADAIRDLPSDAIVGVDIPIGLMEKGQRACDRAARKLLGRPRGSSVFSSPVRGVLGIRGYREACDAHRRIDGRGMSRQSYAIMDKIEQVDAVLRSGPASLRERVVEVHPEVAFCLWNDGQPMTHPKKTAAGRGERQRLIEAAWPGVVDELVRELHATGARYGVDDLHDALAALWTARRVRARTAKTLPDVPPIDRFGLPMRIVA